MVSIGVIMNRFLTLQLGLLETEGASRLKLAAIEQRLLSDTRLFHIRALCVPTDTRIANQGLRAKQVHVSYPKDMDHSKGFEKGNYCQKPYVRKASLT